MDWWKINENVKNKEQFAKKLKDHWKRKKNKEINIKNVQSNTYNNNKVRNNIHLYLKKAWNF